MLNFGKQINFTVVMTSCFADLKFTHVEKTDATSKQEMPSGSSVLPSTEMGEFKNFLRLLPARRVVETIQV